MFRTYDTEDRQHVGDLSPRNVGFAVVDPGKEGVALIYDSGPGLGTWPRPPDAITTLGPNGSGNRTLAARVAQRGLDLLIIEDQFLGKNPQTMKHLVFAAGMLVGQVLHERALTEVLLVPPWAWQTLLPPKKAKGDTKLRAQRHTNERVPRWLKGDPTMKGRYEACADAFTMADWFEWLTRRQERSSR